MKHSAGKPSFILIAWGLCLLFTLSAVAATGFTTARNYEEGTFRDISQDAWYYDDVVSAYELGLVNGKGQGAFDPDGSMTTAEAITLAVRMHAAVTGNDIPTSDDSENWYDAFVRYALDHDFLRSDTYDSFAREIKRHEMASLFARALPQENLTAMNAVLKIPDVSADAPYYSDLMLLYNAGIMMGSDIYGTFYPESDIKRCEVAAIANRIAVPENRLKKTLALKAYGNAYSLAYDSNYNNNYSGLPSGWSFDNRGGPTKADAEKGPYLINDISDEYGVGFYRDLTPTDTGIVTLETSVSFVREMNGFVLEFTDISGKPAYQLFTQDNSFYLAGKDGKDIKLLETDGEPEKFAFRITLNLDEGTCETSINFVSCGTHALLSDSIMTYRLRTTDQDTLTVSPDRTNIYVNYAVNDEFLFTPTETVPYLWKAETTSDTATSSEVKNGEYVLAVLEQGQEQSAAAIRNFDPISGKAVFETLFYLPQKTGTAHFELAQQDAVAVRFHTENGKFYVNDNELRDFQTEMWYRLRIEADVPSQKALIKVNGKALLTVDFAQNVTALDQLKVALDSVSPTSLRFDNVLIHTYTEPADYVPEPIMPSGDDYVVGMNVCSLWRNGTHGGWDCVTPFEELKPVLGYYDEGLPEVADWELKFMAEHGIDFQLFCWYSSQTNAPIKTTGLSAAIHDGYFNAKYSDKVKFALLWEAANAAHPAGSEAFRKYFVPYWVEYFFTDDRYMTIDNKLVIAVFGAGQLIKDFGSEAGVKAEFDYVREVAKELGFDGAIFMACNGSSSDEELQKIKACGFDAVYAYNWGVGGCSPTVTENMITAQQDKNIIHVVPTVSTGFNNIAWAGTRSPNMTVEDYRLVHQWVKDVALKKYEGEKDAWKKNFVMLSTWNEYGEGTYIMPAGLNGFGYLDVVRNAYTEGGVHEDAVPDDSQLARLGYLFPQYRSLIRPLRQTTAAAPNDVYYTWDFGDSNVVNQFHQWSIEGGVKNGVYAGQSTGNDPILLMKEDCSIPIDGVTHVRIRMKGIKNDTLEIFFATADNPNISEKGKLSLTTTEDGMADYVVDMTQNSLWNGMLTKLRIDPMTAPGPFEIESIELLYSKDNQKLAINGMEQSLDYPMQVINGLHFIPFNPQKGIHYALGSYFTWNKKDGVLTIEANHHTVTFTMGSKAVVVDGSSISAAEAPYLFDGLPMLPAEVLADALGFEIKEQDGQWNLVTHQYGQFEIAAQRVAYEYEFTVPGDTEGWTFGNSTGTVLDGAIIGSAVKQSSQWPWDPILYSPEQLKLDASQYKKIQIAMKHSFTSDKEQKIGIYFSTPTLGWSQDRYIGQPLASSQSEDYVVYEFDMTTLAEWKGEISRIRVDPFDCEGTFEIDYIRFLK